MSDFIGFIHALYRGADIDCDVQHLTQDVDIPTHDMINQTSFDSSFVLSASRYEKPIAFHVRGRYSHGEFREHFSRF